MTQKKGKKQKSNARKAHTANNYAEISAKDERDYDEAPLPYGFHRTRNCQNCHPEPSFFEPTDDDATKFHFGKVKFYSDLSKQNTDKNSSHEQGRNSLPTLHSMEKRKKSVYLSEIEFSGLKPANTSKTRLKKCFY